MKLGIIEIILLFGKNLHIIYFENINHMKIIIYNKWHKFFPIEYIIMFSHKFFPKIKKKKVFRKSQRPSKEN